MNLKAVYSQALRHGGVASDRFWIIGELEGVVFVGFAGMEYWLLKDSAPSVGLKAVYSQATLRWRIGF